MFSVVLRIVVATLSIEKAAYSDSVPQAEEVHSLHNTPLTCPLIDHTALARVRSAAGPGMGAGIPTDRPSLIHRLFCT